MNKAKRKALQANLAYVGESDEFEKTKFYLDDCGEGWARRIYYNPDSDAGGQLVDDLLSAKVISEAAKSTNERDFWGYLDEHAKQTLVDIDMPTFAGYAKDFAEDPCDLEGESAETMEALIKWAAESLRNE